MTDFVAARRTMVESQIRTVDVTDLRVQAAFEQVPRELFVPLPLRGLAYSDLDLALGAAQRMLRPMVLARLVQALEIGPESRVLDLNCGTGYSAAVLSLLAGEVVAVDEDPQLAAQALSNLRGLGHSNIVVRADPLARGAADAGPFDAILIEGGVEIIANGLFAQLKDGGRLTCICREGPVGRGTIFASARGEISRRAMFDAPAPVLAGFAREPTFSF